MIYYPLSYPQREVYDVERIFPDEGVNNLLVIFKVGHAHSHEEVTVAVNAMCSRFDAFRLRIKSENGSDMYQYFVPFEQGEYEHVDFSDNDEAFELWKKSIIYSLSCCENEPLYKIFILTLPNNKTGIALLFNHLITDLYSFVLCIDYLMKELRGEPISVAAPTFRSALEDEASYISSKRFIKDGEYWKKKISTYSGSSLWSNHRLKYDKAICKRERFCIEQKLMDRILYLCEAQNLTFAQFFSGVVLYYRAVFSGNHSVSLGFLTFGRTTPEDSETVGAFAHALPLITNINENMTVEEFLLSVVTDLYALQKHHKYPYEKMQEYNLNGSGLFETVLSFQEKDLSQATYGEDNFVEWV